MVDVPGLQDLKDALTFTLIEAQPVGGDLRLRLRRRPCRRLTGAHTLFTGIVQAASRSSKRAVATCAW